MAFHDPLLYKHFENPPADIALDDIDLSKLPTHVSFIMDGNGRWAQARHLDRSFGHKAGVSSLREAVVTSVRLGIRVMSAYAFSTENWNRPQKEVDLLMHLFAQTLVHELPLFAENNVKLVFFGDLTRLPAHTQEVFARGVAETAHNTGMVFALSVNYGSRAELARAARMCAQEVAAGHIESKDINEDYFCLLYTS